MRAYLGTPTAAVVSSYCIFFRAVVRWKQGTNPSETAGDSAGIIERVGLGVNSLLMNVMYCVSDVYRLPGISL